MAIRDRLIQLTLRARDFLSRDIEPASAAVRDLAEEGKRLKTALNEAGRARTLARTLRDNEQAAEGLERAWKDAEATLDDLTREFGESDRATAGQRIAMREARQAAEAAERAWKRNQSAIRNTTSELNRLGVDTRDIVGEEQRLTNELAENKDALDQNRAAIKRKREEEKKAADAADQHTSRVTAAREAMSSGAKKVLAFAAAYVSLNAALGIVSRGLGLIRTGIGDMLRTGDEFEGLQTRLTALMGSVEAGERATAWIKDFATNTPLQLQEVTEAFAGLKAYGIDPMDGTLQALVDQNEKLGGGLDRLQGIVSAVGQAWAKEKLQTEEILQLVERGVPVWEMLARVTGKNTAELQELASKGKLGRAVIRQLMTEIGKSSEGAAAANMSRLTGIMSSLADKASDFYDRIARAGALDYVKGRLQELLAELDRMDGDGRLDKLATAFSNAFVQGAQWVENFARSLVDVDFQKLTDDSTAWLNGFGTKLDETATKVQLFVAPFRTLFNGMTSGLSIMAASVTSKFSEALTAVEKAAEHMPDLLGGEKLRASIKEAKGMLDGLTAGFVAQVEQDGEDISSSWDTTTEKITAGAAAQTEAVKREADDQFEHIVQRVTGINNALAQIDAAEGAQQLRQLGEEMYKAYQRGDLTQEQYSDGLVRLNARVRELGGAASETAGDAGDLAEAQKELGHGAEEAEKKVEKSTASLAEQRDAIGETMTAVRRGLSDVGGGAQEASAGISFFDDVLSRARTPLAEMSESALQAFDALQGISNTDLSIDTSSADKTAAALRDVNRELGEMRWMMATEGQTASQLGKWMLGTLIRSKELQASYLSQKESLQTLMERYESGEISLKGFISAARGAKGRFDLLGDSDLSALESALASAKQRMDALGESTNGTLESLQMELLQLQGTQEEIERARFEQRRQDLRTQLADATATKDATAINNLQQSLSVLDQIERESANRRRIEEAQKRAESAAKAKAEQPQPPAKTIRLETARGQAVDIGLQSEQDETRLLGILESAGLRSL